MKKTKNLVLNRETLRSLSLTEKAIHGGEATVAGDPSLDVRCSGLLCRTV